MVDDEITDGNRIGRLLSSELHGHQRGVLGQLSVVDADPDAELSDDGTLAYAVEPTLRSDDDRERVVEVYLHPDGVRVSFRTGVEAAVQAADREGLDVRRTTTEPPRADVFVESGAAVKGALRVVRAVADGRLEDVG